MKFYVRHYAPTRYCGYMLVGLERYEIIPIHVERHYDAKAILVRLCNNERYVQHA